MKTLTDLAVLQAAEELMFQTGQTTTLDVKNLLRKQGYEATQAEVSSRMENVSRQESWQTNSAGAYKVYKPAPDTDQKIQTYWENASLKLFWELQVTGKDIAVAVGKIGTDGATNTVNYRTNREAVREAQLLMQAKKTEGYNSAADSRLPFLIRQHFATHFSKTVANVRLAYFGVLQERSGANSAIEKKEGGYAFEWNLPAESTQLEEILEKEGWSAVEYQKTPVQCLGERITSGSKPRTQEEDAKFNWQTTKLDITQSKLFQASLIFTDGTGLKLNRYDNIFADKNNQRQPAPTFWNTVKRFILS